MKNLIVEIVYKGGFLDSQCMNLVKLCNTLNKGISIKRHEIIMSHESMETRKFMERITISPKPVTFEIIANDSTEDESAGYAIVIGSEE